MEKWKRNVFEHYQAVADDCSAEYDPSYEGYPANLKRLELLLARLRELKGGRLLDCGCGEGTPLCRIHDAGVHVWGFDLAPQMVQKAKVRLESRGLKNRVWHGDITEASAFRPAGIDIPEKFDVCIAMGVFPHIEDEIGALKNMAAVTRQGGRVFVEFRNELFALYTLNRYSYEFLSNRLIRLDELKIKHPEYESQLEQVASKLEEFFRLDLPPVRPGPPGAPGYDEILSRFHNPLAVGDSFVKAGFRIAEIYFYHYHAIPPLFEEEYPQLFRALSLEMEGNPRDSRGYFMSSAFVVEAVREDGGS